MCRRTITLNYKYNHSNRKETFLKFIFYRTLPSLTVTRALFFLWDCDLYSCKYLEKKGK